jgi:hypothetical protein
VSAVQQQTQAQALRGGIARFRYFIGNNTGPDGWVQRSDAQPVYSGTDGYKYATSLYTIFKLGEDFSITAEEATFGFVSELAISLIYGARARHHRLPSSLRHHLFAIARCVD